jgi:urease accessory protein UreE
MGRGGRSTHRGDELVVLLRSQPELIEGNVAGVDDPPQRAEVGTDAVRTEDHRHALDIEGQHQQRVAARLRQGQLRLLEGDVVGVDEPLRHVAVDAGAELTKARERLLGLGQVDQVREVVVLLAREVEFLEGDLIGVNERPQLVEVDAGAALTETHERLLGLTNSITAHCILLRM